MLAAHRATVIKVRVLHRGGFTIHIKSVKDLIEVLKYSWSIL